MVYLNIFEGSPGFGTESPFSPPMREQPAWGWVTPIGSDDAKGVPHNLFGAPEKPFSLPRPEGIGCPERMKSCAPKDFICHPIADSGEGLLPEQKTLQRKHGVAIQDDIETFSGKGSALNEGRKFFP